MGVRHEQEGELTKSTYFDTSGNIASVWHDDTYVHAVLASSRGSSRKYAYLLKTGRVIFRRSHPGGNDVVSVIVPTGNLLWFPQPFSKGKRRGTPNRKQVDPRQGSAHAG